MKTFSDKQKLSEFTANRPAPQEMLKSILQVEMITYQTVTQSHEKKI